MKKMYLMAAAMLTMTAAVHAANETKMGMEMMQGATKVLSDLHRTDLAEIEMGKLAKDKGTSDAVKAYGKALIEDHQKTEDQVKQLADQLKIKLADKDESMAGKEHAEMAKLKDLKGVAFDKAFATAMLDGHTKAIERLTKAQSEVSGPVTDLITQTLPALKKHQSMAQQLLNN